MPNGPRARPGDASLSCWLTLGCIGPEIWWDQHGSMEENPHGTGGFNLPQKDGFSSVINGL